MSLREHVAATQDKFELGDVSKVDGRFGFPCCVCKHNSKDEMDQPCRTCAYNLNCEKE